MAGAPNGEPDRRPRHPSPKPHAFHQGAEGTLGPKRWSREGKTSYTRSAQRQMRRQREGSVGLGRLTTSLSGGGTALMKTNPAGARDWNRTWTRGRGAGFAVTRRGGRRLPLCTEPCEMRVLTRPRGLGLFLQMWGNLEGEEKPREERAFVSVHPRGCGGSLGKRS